MEKLLGHGKGRTGGRLAWLVAAGFLGGCATASSLYPPPTPGQMAATEAAVTVAREENQIRDANAARHLRNAEMQLATAKEHAAANDNRSAVMMLARAQADAELSQALSRRAKASADATEAERVLEEVRSAPSVPPPGATGARPLSESTPAPEATPAPGAAPALQPAPPVETTSGTLPAPTPARTPTPSPTPAPAPTP